MSVAVALTFVSAGVPVARAVELAFAVAASTFCPMLLLGIWWRGLTARGVIAGLVVGGGLSMSAVVATTFGVDWEGWFGVVIRQPAAVTVPMAFATMVVVSILTRATVPKHVNLTMVRLHAPEHIDLDRGSLPPRPLPRRSTVGRGRDRSSRQRDRSSRLRRRTATARALSRSAGSLPLRRPASALLACAPPVAWPAGAERQ